MADFDVIVVGRGAGNTNAVLAMRHGLSVDDVAETVHAHPTLSKALEAAFREVTRQ
ncbi:hypothetical protein [Natrinema sp. HArc-T2]|uniref:hypothetical protein n=1 Tax=Natrinema sp. HArc-T2 TaxID=3242701 RepID=UPI00359D17CF